MSQKVHPFDTGALDWTPHNLFDTLRVKVLETRATQPHASVMLVRLAVGGEIPTHLHEIESETAYVISGHGVLQVEDETIPFSSGQGATVYPGNRHSVTNLGSTEMEILAIHTPPVR